MRLSVLLALLPGLLLISPAQALISKPEPGKGGFVGATVSAVSSDVADSTGIAAKIVFGPNITDNLSLEFGVLDMGNMQFDDPTVTYPEDEDDLPTFSGTENGSTSRVLGAGSEPGTVTYTGLKSYHPRSALINLRYSFSFSDSISAFVKGGANVWKADLYETTIIAYQAEAEPLSVTEEKTDKISGVSGIFGAGMYWEPWKNWLLRAELETTTLEVKEISKNELFMFGLGLQYEF